MTEKTQSSQTESDNEKTQEISQSRRDAMKKLGKYAAYTPPAVVTLLASRRVPAQISGT